MHRTALLSSILLALGSAKLALAQMKPAALSPVNDTPEGRAMIERIVRSYGGAEAIAKVTSCRITMQTIVLRNDANGVPIPPTTNPAPGEVRVGSIITIVFPDRSRFEFMRLQDGVKRHGIEVLMPGNSWGVLDNQFDALTPAAEEGMRRSIELNLIYLLQQGNNKAFQFNANSIEHLGTKDYAVLDIAGPDDLRSRWLLDPATGRIMRKIDSAVDPKGNVTEVTTQYQEWETVGGVVVPRRWRTSARNSVSMIQAKFEINPPIDATVFQRPATTQATTQPATPPKAGR